jgi:hypothetical protein
MGTQNRPRILSSGPPVLDGNDNRFDKHEGKIVRLTVAGAQVATALAVKMNNPLPDAVFQKLAESYERIHGGNLADTPT